MGSIKVGIIGAGSITSAVHLPLLTCMRGVEVGYVADIKDPTPLASLYGTTGVHIEDVSQLPSCDCVLLAIPVGSREPYIKEFGKRGTPVFSEKPFAADTKSHLKFLRMAKKTACNYMRVCYSSVGRLAAVVQSGVFGSLERIEITEGGIIGKTGKETGHYQTDPKLSGGGILAEKGCHSLSQLATLLEGYKFGVEEAGILFHGDLDVDVSASIKARKAKSSVDIDFRLSMIRPIRNRLSVRFPAAELHFDHTDPGSPVTVDADGTNFALQPEVSLAATTFQAFYLRWKHYLGLIEKGINFDSEKESFLEVTRMTESIYKKGRP